MKKLFAIFTLVICALPYTMKAQNVIEVQPLFEYPVAPEELVSIEDKCNYLVKNFWNNFDFKKKDPLDQYALNEAFQIYCTTLQFADSKEVNQSFDKLIKNMSGNPVMLMQFCKAAEENLYGPRADFWSDSLYLKFLDAILKNKKIKDNRKSRYMAQAEALKGSAFGNTASSFTFTDLEGSTKNYFPMSTPTLLIFGDPEDPDWRLQRLKMESNYNLDEALEKGKVNILFIVTSDNDKWQDSVSGYNKNWTIGKNTEVSKIYDLRASPSIYIIDSTGKIVNKNILPQTAVSQLLEMVN